MIPLLTKTIFFLLTLYIPTNAFVPAFIPMESYSLFGTIIKSSLEHKKKNLWIRCRLKSSYVYIEHSFYTGEILKNHIKSNGCVPMFF